MREKGTALRKELKEDLVSENSFWDWVPSLIAFLVIYATLLFFFRPSLLFSTTTTAGGDTGGYHYATKFFIDELLPRFRITGWAPGWYAGMPMLTFYFPFPFVLMAILDWVIPYQIAFKIVTVLGVFALPATAYAMARLWRIRKPFPVIAAVFGLAFLFMQSYSIYGGNILSTLAGEFGYMLSFALVLLFLGTMSRGMENPRFDLLFVLNCLILMALALSHVITTIVLVCIIPGLLLVHRGWRSLGYLVAVGLVGFCLTAFWSIPFAVDLKWTAHMTWTNLKTFKDFLPTSVLPITGMALVGMAFAVARKEIKLLPLAWITAITVLMFWVVPNGRLWNARVLPFFYVSLHLWAAYGVAWLIRPFAVMMRDLFRLRGITSRRLFVAVIALIVAVIAGITSPTAASWIRWNYSGYEGKATWSTYKAINDFIATLPPGRVMWEHSPSVDELGTPRAFEIIPYWTGQPTMEGTFMESSFTAPFHFINQAELSKQPSHAISGVSYPPRNATDGIAHLQFMNVPYLLTVSTEVSSEVAADGRAELLASFGRYNVYRIAGTSGYVEIVKNQPLRLAADVKQWRQAMIEWYLDTQNLSVPIVMDKGEGELQKFPEISLDQAASPPAIPLESDGQVLSEQVENDRIIFDTTAIGVPHWIKVSYFPNWKVKGAKGPYLVAPSFMMVIPTQSHVELYYGRTMANTVGQALTGAAWALIFGLGGWRLVLWRRRRQLEGAVEASEVANFSTTERKNL